MTAAATNQMPICRILFSAFRSPLWSFLVHAPGTTVIRSPVKSNTIRISNILSSFVWDQIMISVFSLLFSMTWFSLRNGIAIRSPMTSETTRSSSDKFHRLSLSWHSFHTGMADIYKVTGIPAVMSQSGMFRPHRQPG